MSSLITFVILKLTIQLL